MERLCDRFISIAGSSASLFTALAVVLVWLATGPIFHYSDTWQLVINTGTSVITFLMVFLIQKSQNKETRSLQLKLNELIASSHVASNRLVDVEDLSEAELNNLYDHYCKLAEDAKEKTNIRRSRSIEEAIEQSLLAEKLEKDATILAESLSNPGILSADKSTSN